MDGELESKDYSIQQKSEIEGVTDGRIFDGLELDQIQEGQFTVLFLGTDESRSNTDVMMLAMFDIRGNQIHILQIPRDTFVPGYTTFEAYKINSVYTLGDQGKKPVQRVVDCLESIFKIPIDRYVTTSCTDIVEIVDLIGGIPIDMPYKSPMKRIRSSRKASRPSTVSRPNGWCVSAMTTPKAISAE